MKVVYDAEDRRLEFRCPGCGWTHMLNLDPDRGKPCWKFNGDLDAPTITPSINASWSREDGPAVKRCHSFVEAGSIRFLPDCTHGLAGQTVSLPELLEAEE